MNGLTLYCNRIPYHVGIESYRYIVGDSASHVVLRAATRDRRVNLVALARVLIDVVAFTYLESAHYSFMLHCRSCASPRCQSKECFWDDERVN